MSIERIKIYRDPDDDGHFDFRIGEGDLMWISADSNSITVEYPEKSIIFPIQNVYCYHAYKKGYRDAE